MTVRFSQLVAGRQGGKTTFLASAAVDAAARGKTVAVLLVNSHAVQPFGEACVAALKSRNLEWAFSDYQQFLNVTKDDTCEHCHRGDKVTGSIYFVTRQGPPVHHSPDMLLIDNAEFMALDDQSVEEAVLDIAFECTRQDKDLNVITTTTERPLELSGELTF